MEVQCAVERVNRRQLSSQHGSTVARQVSGLRRQPVILSQHGLRQAQALGLDRHHLRHQRHHPFYA